MGVCLNFPPHGCGVPVSCAWSNNQHQQHHSTYPFPLQIHAAFPIDKRLICGTRKSGSGSSRTCHRLPNGGLRDQVEVAVARPRQRAQQVSHKCKRQRNSVGGLVRSMQSYLHSLLKYLEVLMTLCRDYLYIWIWIRIRNEGPANIIRHLSNLQIVEGDIWQR